MTSPDSELRKLLQTIATDNSLTIYDRVPEQSAGNYVHISDISSSDAFTADQVIWDTELLLDIVTNFDTNKGGRKTADTIGNTLLTALVDKYQSMTGFAIAKSTILNMNYIDEPTDRGYIIRKIIRIELQIEEVDLPIIPDGAIVTKDGSMIILTTGSDYILTVDGFVPLNLIS